MGLCACGCGREAKPGRTFLRAHAGHKAIREARPPDVWDDRLWTVEDHGHVTPCWIWRGTRVGGGYGKLLWERAQWMAHRLAWVLRYGPIPPGFEIDHACHDPRRCAGGDSCPHRGCVNPDHLRAVTPAENARASGKAKLTMEAARIIRSRYAAGGVTQTALATEYGVRQATIFYVLNGTTWREEAP